MRKRVQKKSIFICCEGKTEVAFLKYVKSLYLDGRKKYVQIKSAGGGGLRNIENTIEKHDTQGAFDQTFGFLDGDLIGISKVQKENILITKPCIEGFFLELLNQDKPVNSKQCKKKFEVQFLNEKEKLNHKCYEKIFTKNQLEKIREENTLLDKLLKVFE